jgi:hypothetical protein
MADSEVGDDSYQWIGERFAWYVPWLMIAQ